MDTWWSALVLWVLAVLVGGGVLFTLANSRVRTSAVNAAHWWWQRRRWGGSGRRATRCMPIGGGFGPRARGEYSSGSWCTSAALNLDLLMRPLTGVVGTPRSLQGRART